MFKISLICLLLTSVGTLFGSNHIPVNPLVEFAQERGLIFAHEEELMTTISTEVNCPDSFHLVNIAKLEKQLDLWHKHLPSVTPFYAVKTNHDPVIIEALAFLGLDFECASKGEIHQLLKIGVDPSKIIFSHPRKSLDAIEFARDFGVETFVFDSIEELNRMKASGLEGQFILRIAVEDDHSSCPLNSKFGVSIEKAQELIDECVLRNENLVGISFHVGSNCWHIPSYQKAIEDSASLFCYAKEKWNKELTVLDLGGGWPGTQNDVFMEIAKAVEDSLKVHFNYKVSIIAEPGRYFAASTTTTAVRVLGKVVEEDDQGKKIAYYLSNGIYDSFSNSLYYNFDSDLLAKEGWNFRPLNLAPSSQTYISFFWGATCDSVDRIYNELLFPEVETDDFIYSKNTGAYTYSLQTDFNQIPRSKPYYIYERDS